MKLYSNKLNKDFKNYLHQKKIVKKIFYKTFPLKLITVWLFRNSESFYRNLNATHAQIIEKENLLGKSKTKLCLVILDVVEEKPVLVKIFYFHKKSYIP